MPNKHNIIINGNMLNQAQCMTIRAALDSFFLDLSKTGLGDDDLGKEITNNYICRIREIRKYLHKG